GMNPLKAARLDKTGGRSNGHHFSVSSATARAHTDGAQEVQRVVPVIRRWNTISDRIGAAAGIPRPLHRKESEMIRLDARTRAYLPMLLFPASHRRRLAWQNRRPISIFSWLGQPALQQR